MTLRGDSRDAHACTFDSTVPLRGDETRSLYETQQATRPEPTDLEAEDARQRGGPRHDPLDRRVSVVVAALVVVVALEAVDRDLERRDAAQRGRVRLGSKREERARQW